MTEPTFNSAAIESIADLARQAASASGKVYLAPIPNHPLGAHLIVNPDGRHEEYTPPRPPRTSQLYSIDQVGLYASHARDRWQCQPAIYYSDSEVIIRLHDGDNDQFVDRASYELLTSPAWDLLHAWSENPDSAWMAHGKFMRMLRVSLGDCFDKGELKLLSDQIGQLDFVQGDRVQSVAVRNRESMGREIASEVRATVGEIPEEVYLALRIYRDPLLMQKHEIRCLLETDPKNGLLALIPAPGQLDEALDAEMTSLGEKLRANVRPVKKLTDTTGNSEEPFTAPAEEWQIPVFYGTP